MRIFILLFFSITIFQAQENNSVLSEKEKIIKLGMDAYLRKDSIQLKKQSLKLLHLFKKNQDSFLLAKHYYYNALNHKLNYTNDSAFFYYHKSGNIFKNLKDSLEVGRRYLSIGSLQKNSKDLLGSEISCIEALKYLEPIKAYKYLERTYNILGIVSNQLSQYKEAVKYYNKALVISGLYQSENKSGLLYILNNLGIVYIAEENYVKAITYFKKGLAFDSIKSKYPLPYSFLLQNLANSNLALGNKKDVLKQYTEVLSIATTINNNNKISGVHLCLAKYYKQEKDNRKAKFHANKSLEYAKTTHNHSIQLGVLDILSDISSPTKAKEYLEDYIVLNDSLIQKERTLKNQFAKIRYQTNKKEKENVFLKIENDKNEVEINYHKQQKIIGWLLFAASLLGLGFTVLFFIVRRRRLIYESKLQKIKAREKERQQIAKSLHDEVAGDLRVLHHKLEKSGLSEEAEKLNIVKENVRTLSHKLSSVSFDKVSFKDQVVNLVSDYFELNFRIKIEGINDCEWKEINGAIKRLLYLSIRESIQNCKKHADATKVTIKFSVHKKNVFLSIIDNGIGFNANKGKKGIGLKNLEERIEELNGTLVINSESNNGAKIYIEIPLNAYKNKNITR